MTEKNVIFGFILFLLVVEFIASKIITRGD
jgi:hypothetical protein